MESVLHNGSVYLVDTSETPLAKEPPKFIPDNFFYNGVYLSTNIKKAHIFGIFFFVSLIFLLFLLTDFGF